MLAVHWHFTHCADGMDGDRGQHKDRKREINESGEPWEEEEKVFYEMLEEVYTATQTCYSLLVPASPHPSHFQVSLPESHHVSHLIVTLLPPSVTHTCHLYFPFLMLYFSHVLPPHPPPFLSCAMVNDWDATANDRLWLKILFSRRVFPPPLFLLCFSPPPPPAWWPPFDPP